MEVHLSPEHEAALSKLAGYKGQDADTLAQQVLNRYIEEEARFVEAVKLGEEQLERGEYLTNEEVGARIESWFKP